MQIGLAGHQHEPTLVEQAPRHGLHHEGFQVAAPQARVDDIGAGLGQRGDLRAVLAGAELGHLRGGHARIRPERLHRQVEVVPGVLAPGVVLVDAGVGLDVGALVEQVERRGHCIHRRVRTGAEHVLVAALLEHARSAAVEQHGELLHLLGHRRDGQAIAAGDVADDEVDVLPLHQVAELAHLLGGPARFVDDYQLQGGAAEAAGVVGRRRLAGVEGLDDGLGRDLRRHAKWARSRAGQEGDETDANSLALLRLGRAGTQQRARRSRPGSRRSAGASTRFRSSRGLRVCCYERARPLAGARIVAEPGAAVPRPLCERARIEAKFTGLPGFLRINRITASVPFRA